MPLAATGPDTIRWRDATDAVLLTMARAGTIDGVEVVSISATNGIGTGKIRTTGQNADRLQWRAPGSSVYGEPVPVGDGGEFIVIDGEDSNKFVRVNVTAAYLQDTPRESSVFSGGTYNELGDDITASEASSGTSAEFALRLANYGNVIASNLVAWLDAETGDLEISVNGSTWVSPTSEATGISFGDVGPGDYAVLYCKRTISSSSSYDANVLEHLHLAYDAV